ncbi:XRE family transcriptional regulator [Pedobacter sp. KBW06]|uniref:helix-turn-helix transcriptional regulator n=1 Tax=Pedobacter sp. KBW06 TaxID=2153359 RepID=UPI000F5B5713|nr:helix-turn-helix transcriptional regulator [Pedobacter sp. KBW06]RQO75575.1 XRE family transcriptional regulator [Pedobacter sp. KBW06]
MPFESLKIKDVKINIGELVKLVRKREKVTQEELAELLNLSKLTIHNLEAGRNTNIDTLLKVFQHFDLLEKFNQQLLDNIQDQHYDSLY